MKRDVIKQKICGRAKAIAWMCTLVYFASYLTRNNFSVMMLNICNEMGTTKTALAIVVTGLTVSYGLGQIISGLMGDKIKPQLMLTMGLSLACACNIAIFFCSNIILMTVIWCINGFAHSMLWPPIVRIMSMYLTDEEYSYSAVRVSWGSSFATILMYLVLPQLLKLTSWRILMLVCAAVGIGIMIAWTLTNPRFLKDPITNVSVSKNESKNESPTLTFIKPPSFVYLPIVLIMLGIILQGILRDGVQNWMPFYLSESFGIPESDAITSTVLLAVFSVISFAVFDLLHRKVFKNEVFCAAVIFALSAVSALILYIVALLTELAIPAMLLMAIIVASMHGINLMLITVVPKRFVKSGKVSTYSGILNACTYIGAALSSYGFAALAESFGWNFTILMWVFVSIAGLAVCLAATPMWKKFRKEYSDAP